MVAPSGTSTFLFTDIEGSTYLWETAPDSMRAALERHDTILRQAIESHEGHVFSTGGDGFAAAFSRAADAMGAASSAQEALRSEAWPDGAYLRVRMGLHTGEATEREGNYFGPTLNRAARLMALGHGGQILASSATAEMLDGVALTALGEHRLRDLSEPVRIYQLGAESFPSLRSVENYPTNLPSQVSSFVGRDHELAQLSKALDESRVVTLTGVGGVGKTRLALQGAAEVLPRFREGAWLVELAPLRDPDAVAGAVAAVFGVTPQTNQSTEECLIELLRAKALLLVLDNCEHLLDPVGELVEVLAGSCPSLVVLATSREGLAVEGERILAVPSLQAPPLDSDLDVLLQADAGSLFVDRATSVDAEFTVDQHNAAAVAQICRRLDGVPLAIELAAARVTAMTPGELAEALDRRFETLAGRRRRAVERHQTLRAAIDWSYDLCAEPERRLLARLAVFVGGCTRAAAEAVCAGEPIRSAEVFELLAGLVGKSLVVAQRDGPRTRYRLLETIREYAEERLADLGETEALRSAHARYYSDEAAAQREEYHGPGQVDALRFLESELENLQAVIDQAVETADADLGLQLFSLSTLPGSSVAHRPEVQRQLDAILRLPGVAEHPLYPFGLARVASFAALRGDLVEAEARCEEARTAAGRRRLDPENELLFEIVVAFVRRSVARSPAQWREAADHAERVVALARSVGHVGALQSSLVAAAQCHTMAGEPDIAVSRATEALDVAQQVGAPWSIAILQVVLGTALAEREPERARDLLHEGTQSLDKIGIFNSVDADAILRAAAWIRDWPLVLEVAPRAIRQTHWSGMRPGLARSLDAVARAIAATDPDSTAVILGAGRRLTAPIVSLTAGTGVSEDDADMGVSLWQQELRLETTTSLEHSIGEEKIRVLGATGEAMGEDEAVAFALVAIERAVHTFEGVEP